MRQAHINLSLLVVCAAAAVISAQPTPQPPPPDASSPPEAHERANVSDAQLGLEVQSRLYQALDISNLSALVRYGVATLNGRVHSEEDKQRAQQMALDVQGVESVVNELLVETPVVVALATQAQEIVEREDSDLETEVTNRLRLDPVLGSRNIRVDTDDVGNTLTLTGTVSTQDEKEQAGRIAVNSFPAGRVRNQIEVQQRL
ncbi:MAG TPA: BON domain-containing protein [Gammaproteobacteria bacterium]|nr:BON domain-containing protein [Gammaproteobacteria bacterium]